ncbi:Uncharacterised protein [Mycobacteroides abscessus subsp. abscessus]|nr:Uncharacterised protein [Mycobacteroides abscessus subsp. abscessus]
MATPCQHMAEGSLQAIGPHIADQRSFALECLPGKPHAEHLAHCAAPTVGTDEV